MSQFAAYGRLLRENRNVRVLWLAQVISELGDWLYSLGIYSFLLERTGHAESVGIAVVLQLLPQVLVSPLAGVVNDYISRRSVMIGTDLGRAVVVGAMVWAAHADSVGPVYVLLILETLLWAFFEPARSAIVPNLTRSEEETANANALSSITWSVNFSLGAALGGLLGVWLGRDAVFLLNAVSFLASGWCAYQMRFREPHLTAKGPLRVRSLFDYSPYRDGVEYILGDRRLLATLLVKAGFGAVGAHWVLLPLLGERVFPVQMQGYTAAQAGLLGMSILTSMRGLGALIGPMLSNAWAGANQCRLRSAVLVGFCGVALGYSSLGRAPSLPWACASLLLLAAGGGVVWVSSTTLLQMQTEDRFRGRVFSADFSFLTTMMAAVSLTASLLIDRGVPPRQLASILGVVAVIPAVLWLLAQRLWREERAGEREQRYDHHLR